MPRTHIPLRLEGQNGSGIEEYRVHEGRVEVRSLRSPSLRDFDDRDFDDEDSGWMQLTRQQLSAHVEHSTVVAQWLERRLGWRRLLQACVGQEPPVWSSATEDVQQDAA